MKYNTGDVKWLVVKSRPAVVRIAIVLRPFKGDDTWHPTGKRQVLVGSTKEEVHHSYLHDDYDEAVAQTQKFNMRNY